MPFLKRSGWLFLFLAITIFFAVTNLFGLRSLVWGRFEETWGWLGGLVIIFRIIQATELGLFFVRMKRSFESPEAVGSFNLLSFVFELGLAFLALVLCLLLPSYWFDPLWAILIELLLVVGLGSFLSIFQGR